jgi:hypothetical protein
MSRPQFEINNEAVKDASRMTPEECPVILIIATGREVD